MSERSYSVVVRTERKMLWEKNELRFCTRFDAEQYALDLKMRWRQVVEYRVQVRNESPNTIFPVPNQRYIIEKGV